MEYWYDYTDSASWTSSSPSIAEIVGYGLIKGVSAGTAQVQAPYSGETYAFQGSYCNPNPLLPGDAICPSDVSQVTIQTGADYNPFAFVGTNDSSVTQYNLQAAVGYPNGGNYTWSATPQSVTFTNNYKTGSSVTLTGSTPSSSVLGTTEQVKYTLTGYADAFDTRAITLREFNALTTPSQQNGCPDDQYAPQITTGGYLEEFTYNILTTPGTQQVQSGFPGMTVSETVQVNSVTPSNYQVSLTTGQAPSTSQASQVFDCLGIPSPSNPPLPANLVVCATQTISMGGIQVQTNKLKYTSTSVSIVSSCP